MSNNFNNNLRGTIIQDDVSCSALNSGLFTVSMKYKEMVKGMFYGHDHNNDYEYEW